MAYVKIIFQNSPSTATPINAQNLNHMDDQIALNDQRLTAIETAGVVNTFNGRTGNVVPQKGDYDVSQIGATDGQNGYVPVWRNSGTEESPDWGFNMEPQSGSGTGGHTIVDQDGTDMASEDDLQFADSFVSDDSVNGRTIVENIKVLTKAQWENVSEDGLYDVDIDDAEIGPASEDYVEVTADGEKTYATLLNEIASDTDFSKVIDSAYLISESIFGAKNVFVLRAHSNSSATFFHGTSESTGSKIRTYHITPNGSLYEESVGTSYSDKSTDKPSNGTKITLYYGNKSAVIDLQTTANRCLMSDGETTVADMFVKNQLTVIAGSNVDIITSGTGSMTIINKIGNVVSGMIRLKATAQIASGIIAQIDGISILNHYITTIEKYDDDTILSKPVFIQNNPNQSNSIIIYSYAQLLSNTQYRISFTFLVN